MSIPYDYCRCLGQGCSFKETCERFVDKGVGAMRLSYTNFFMASDNFCSYYIPVEFLPPLINSKDHNDR